LEPDISKKQNPLLFVRFLSVAGDRFPHRRQEKEEGRRLLQPPCFPFDFRGGAPPLFIVTEDAQNSPALFPKLFL
jgi:hypothetical protein